MVEKKTVIITGSTSGIGRALLEAFVQKDYVVFAGYRNEKLKENLEKIHNVIPFYIDMSKKETISEAVKYILQKTDKIDTVINAAGCVISGAMECLDIDKIRYQFDVNTFSHLDFIQGLMPVLKNSKIINISSMASFGIFPFVGPYCASKRALDILFNSMLLEFKRNDIKIISIKPGVIKTPLWEKSIELNKEVFETSKQNNVVLKRVQHRTSERLCDPETNSARREGNVLDGFHKNIEQKYEKEFEFLVKNAQKNAESGLDVQNVVDLIVKVDNMKKPKASYTVGFDAKCAEIFSKLPQDWINFLVKKGFEKRVGL